jgi:iron complex transport system ATP-binding protein
MGDGGLVVAPASAVLAALQECAAVGPFFAVEVPPPPPHSPHERDGSLGFAPPDQTGVAFTRDDGAGSVAAAVEAVRGWAGDGVHPRVGASLFFMSYTGRLLSAALGGVLLGGVLLDVSGMCWRYVRGSGVQLRLAVPTGWTGDRAALLSALEGSVIGERLGSMVATIRELVPVSERLLWGNAASSLAGALGVLASSGRVPAAQCRAAGERLLASAHLHGTGRFTDGLNFRRRTCCLYYRVSDGALCGDCVLRR